MTPCPRCSSSDCFAAPWQSDTEKQAHRGHRPYRCKSCLHRFYLAGGLRRLQDNPLAAAVGAGTLVMVVAVVIIMWFWSGRTMSPPTNTAPPSPSSQRATSSAVAYNVNPASPRVTALPSSPPCAPCQLAPRLG